MLGEQAMDDLMLPEPAIHANPFTSGYTADQMREYAKKAVDTLDQDNASLREQNTMLDAKLAELEVRQPLTTPQYVEALGPLLYQIVCSAGTLRRVVRAIEAAHGIKEKT